MFLMSLEEIKFDGSSTTWTRSAKEKLTNRVTKYTELKATLTFEKDENWFLGKITIIERTCEDPSTLKKLT